MTNFNPSHLRSSFEKALDDYVLSLKTPIEMLKPMLYSLKNGGKRLRPLLLLSFLEVHDPKSVKEGMHTALALEFIHTYSLIHDDLPAMDNDLLRRGQPSSHVQFDEATAILAGDALLTDSFALISSDPYLKARMKVKLITSLSQAAGSMGMVAGQIKDIQAEEKKISIEELQGIHALKTGCLFNYAVQAAGLINGLKRELKFLEEFSQAFGIAYQIHNDLMDVLGSQFETGKKNHHDQSLHKATYPSLIGLEASKEALEDKIQEARTALSKLNRKTGKPYLSLTFFLDYLSLPQEEADRGQT